MKQLKSAALATVITLATVNTAQAATLIVDVTGMTSNASLRDPRNIVRTFNIGSLSELTSISWNFSLTAFDTSYLSEASIEFSDSALSDSFSLTAGVGLTNPGTQTLTGSGDLVVLGLNIKVGVDGILRLEFYETFDDTGVDPDARYNSGTVTLEYTAAPAGAVPESSTWMMMIAGFGVAGGAMRYRRRKTAVSFG